MKLTAKTDLEAPIGYVYEALSDHLFWERLAAERGIRIERPHDGPSFGPGATWLVHFPYRGKVVKLNLELQDAQPTERLIFDFISTMVEGEAATAMMPLSPRRTRMQMTIDLRPRTIGARLMINTLRLAKGRLEQRLEHRLATMAGQIQARYAERLG